MTHAEFDALKPGDRVDGRNYGDGTVEQNGDALFVRWDRDGAITYQFSVLRDLWGSWGASPMRNWVSLHDPTEGCCRMKNEHTKDSDCTIDPETLLCEVCGVAHSEECPDCGGRGFHKDTCPVLVEDMMDDFNWVGSRHHY